MRLALVAWIALLAAPLGLAQPQAPSAPPAPAPTPASGKLELPPPQTVKAGSGYVKIVARGADKVAFDIYASLDDPKVEIQRDVAGGILFIGIPTVGGSIRVTAAAVIAGAPVIAATTITIEASDRAEAPKGSDKGSDSGKSPAPLLHVTVVGLPESAGLRHGLESANCKYWPYPQANDPRLAAKGLDKQVQKAGGAPAVIVQDAAGNVLAARKATSDQQVADVVNQVRGAP